ncbi:hypothetical protein KXR64_20180 [Brucella intermedia]|uniref:hypothetical protein n=1 Tax=Brucella TaxID=234 RepID=UPI00094629C5|nr:hypothetical protein [Brucella intermedia]
MIRTFLLLLLTASLGGCTSMTYPLPKCDGYSRRQLNRSMWQLEGDAKPANRAIPFTEEPVSASSAAFARFDNAGSYRSCEDR